MILEHQFTGSISTTKLARIAQDVAEIRQTGPFIFINLAFACHFVGKYGYLHLDRRPSVVVNDFNVQRNVQQKNTHVNSSNIQ